MIARLRRRAAALKRDTLALWIAARRTETPLAARLLAFATAAYALSPIDLIPDFLPIIGWLDDLLLVPLGIWLCLRLIPAPLMQRYRAEADSILEKPRSLIGAAVVIAIWIVLALLAWRWWSVAHQGA